MKFSFDIRYSLFDIQRFRNRPEIQRVTKCEKRTLGSTFAARPMFFLNQSYACSNDPQCRFRKKARYS